MKNGISPIHENNLDRIINFNLKEKRLNFSTSIASIPEIIYYFTPKELLPHKLYTLVYPYINYSKTKLVIFDMDGTLYDQKKLRLYMLKHIFFFLLKQSV